MGIDYTTELVYGIQVDFDIISNKLGIDEVDDFLAEGKNYKLAFSGDCYGGELVCYLVLKTTFSGDNWDAPSFDLTQLQEIQDKSEDLKELCATLDVEFKPKWHVLGCIC